MSVRWQVLKNVGALTAARGITSVLSLILMVYLARVLEPSAFGILSWSIAYVIYFKLVPNFGFGVYGQREIARNPQEVQRLAHRILSLRLILAPIAFVASVAVVALLDKPLLFKTVVVVQAVGIFGVALNLDWVYMGLERMGIVAIRNVVVAALTLGGVLLFVHDPDEVVLAAAAMSLSLIGGSLWLLVTYKGDFTWPRLRFDPKDWRILLPTVAPIAAAHALAAINTNMDQLMLGLIRTDTEVGWYGTAYRLLTAALIPSQILLQSFLPSISAALGDEGAMRQRSRDFVTTLSGLGFPIAVGGLLFASDLIGLFGPSYAPAVPAFMILMAFVALQYTSIGFGTSLIAWDFQKLYMYALLGGAVINVALNFGLIPTFGIMGAAIATLSSECIVLSIILVLYFRVVRQVPVEPFLRAAAATAIAAVGLFLLRMWFDLPFVAEMAVFGAAFLGGAYTVRLVDPDALLRLVRQRST